jgi:hypothetical protein
MAPEQQEQATLPTWLREILGDIQTSRMPPRRRAHVRRHWGRVCSVMPDSLSGGPLTVYGLNVCRSGLAFVSQQTFTPGDTLTLTGPFCSGQRRHHAQRKQARRNVADIRPRMVRRVRCLLYEAATCASCTAKMRTS